MIAIIDYGIGNLRSVQKAFEHIGETAEVTSDPARIRSASHVLLPGVGAFAAGMRGLTACGLEETVMQIAASGRPLLGICLGMQLLFEGSEEGGDPRGLGLISGRVTRMRPAGLKVPHVGWNDLTLTDAPLWDGLSGTSYAYFVHSYCQADVTARCVLATTTYGTPFVAAVRQDNLWGMQFHPEKSGDAGLTMLRNFARL